MTVKTLLFSLFLYVCLAWVVAGLRHPDDVVHFGLFWTAVGLIVMLAFVVGARLFGWWRLWRAKAASRPAAPAKPAAIVHEDDAALAALIAEANTKLGNAPGFAAKRGTAPLSGMPLYLLIGPEGSGKTSTFVNFGLEPQLLAGQVTGAAPLMATRLCNLWVAKGAIFAELSGRVFSGDPARWTQLLKVLRGGASIPMWQRLWQEPAQGLALRGVIAFSDAKEFTGTPNSQLLDRRSRDLQERLQAIGDVFGIDFPVYQVFAKGDAIPFFPDFFHRLPESDANQVLGCTLPLREPGTGELTAELQAKRITRSFRQLYEELAKRRLTQLAHEPDRTRRPAIYEFPRELKRIRTPLVQFLSDTFRPHPLRLGPLLRGYYLTGTREVEVAAASVSETRADWAAPKMEATVLFSAAEATRILRAGETGGGLKTAGRGVLVRRWIFGADLFQNVILADRLPTKAAPADQQVELYRRGIFAAACALCFLLCFAFLWSWSRNRALLGDLNSAADAATGQPGKTMLDKLRTLDALREQLQQLINWDRSRPLGLRWGLYSGNRVLDSARLAYFRRFQDLLLNPINGGIVASLEGVSTSPAPDAPDEPTYSNLKTHLMIAGACKPPDPDVVAKVLRRGRQDAGLATNPSEEPALADRQIDFYVRELLPAGKPFVVAENAEVRDHARQYLQRIKGIDRIYKSILSDAENRLKKPQSLRDLAANYGEVLKLKGPAEPSGAFTRANWDSMQSAFKKSNTAASGDPCVLGSSVDGGGSGTQDAEVTRTLQNMYVADYIARWRSFVQGFSVIAYRGPDDAARKLQTLADHKSPLLALFYLTGIQTDFPPTSEERNIIEKASEKVGLGKVFSTKKKAEQEAQKLGLAPTTAKSMSSADITQVFQPVLWVVPPTSDKWVSEKNTPYIQALDGLSHSMQKIADNRLDPAAQQEAQQNYDKAIYAAKQIEIGFRSVGEGGLDTAVQTLLEQPIRNARNYINTNVDAATAGQINAGLRQFCASMNSSILREFPFQPLSRNEVSLQELGSWFGAGGNIWKFQEKSLADLTMNEGSQWKTKDPAKKPQVTQEMLAFLGRAQAIADVFYPGGSAQSLVYSLRPKPDSSLKDWTLTLVIDGQKVDWTPTSSLQKQFTWPVASGKDPGAVGRIGTGSGLSIAFASQSGLWGVFRIMRDAEPRDLMGKIVEWKYLRSGDGRPELLQPPVRLEIVGFPGGVDVFNSNFFQGLQCPSKAAQ